MATVMAEQARLGLALAGLLALGTASEAAIAVEPPALEEVVYLSCAEVAEQAGDDEEQIVAIIRVLAAFSLEQRGLAVQSRH